jgi:hypothetical protein
MNFSQLGINSLKEQSAFKKIQFFSKTNSSDLFNARSDFDFSFNKVASLYTNDLALQNSSSYGTVRQHNSGSLGSTIGSAPSLLDTKSFTKYLLYGNASKDSEGFSHKPDNELPLNLDNYFKHYSISRVSATRNKFNSSPIKSTLLGEKEGTKQLANPLKYLIKIKTHPKKVQVPAPEKTDTTEVDTTAVGTTEVLLPNTEADRREAERYEADRRESERYESVASSFRQHKPEIISPSRRNLLDLIEILSPERTKARDLFFAKKANKTSKSGYKGVSSAKPPYPAFLKYPNNYGYLPSFAKPVPFSKQTTKPGLPFPKETGKSLSAGE